MLLSYKTIGQGNVNIILLHGLGLNLNFWQKNMSTLAQFAKVYALDLIGFGQSEKEGANYSLDEYVETVISFIKTKKLKNVILIGHCFGSAISLKLTNDHPELITKLIMINLPCFSIDIHIFLRLVTLPIIGKLLASPLSKKALQNVLQLNFHKKQKIDQDLMDEHYLYASSKKSIMAFQKTLQQYVDIRGIKKAVLNEAESTKIESIPTLVIWGKDDNIIPISHLEKMTKKITNATVFIFEDCGHMPQFEYPHEVNKLILDFLQDNRL
jgi:4,5:9,10-diseco-3-hydroxy-5,9,17-trioxoandrosta-1(10),2-diene-4-oate hydrolase